MALARASANALVGVRTNSSNVGSLTTRRIVVDGSALLLTADILSIGGSVVVEVVDSGSNVTLATASAVVASADDQELEFPGSQPGWLGSLVGRNVTLKLTIKGATIYGFAFAS
jgi:hypothetical protein